MTAEQTQVSPAAADRQISTLCTADSRTMERRLNLQAGGLAQSPAGRHAGPAGHQPGHQRGEQP
jgi:hypothetical protein